MCKIDLFLLICCIRYDIIFQEELYEAVGFAKTLPFNYIITYNSHSITPILLCYGRISMRSSEHSE